MVSSPLYDNEAWYMLSSSSEVKPLIHYCQQVYLNNQSFYFWNKRDQKQDMLSCGRPLFPLNTVWTEHIGAVKNKMETGTYTHTAYRGPLQALTIKAQFVYVYLNLLPFINDALSKYQQRHCSSH